MGVPQIVIVGRPNVGKSSLFNWLAGRRLAIVDPTAGVTRDRVSHLIELDGRFAELVDTGGMGIEDSDNLTEQVEEQIQTAVDSATILLFVVDTREGPLPLDQEVAKRLRYVDVPVILVANKTDHRRLGVAGRRILQIRAEGDPRQRQGESQQGRTAGGNPRTLAAADRRGTAARRSR